MLASGVEKQVAQATPATSTAVTTFAPAAAATAAATAAVADAALATRSQAAVTIATRKGDAREVWKAWAEQRNAEVMCRTQSHRVVV